MRQISCLCGSPVNLVPFIDDHSVMIPVEPGRDPSGGLVVVGSKEGHTIRPIRDGETVEDRFRRRAHWDACPRRSRWRDAMRAAGVGGTAPSREPERAGPCARCRRRHPWHYGGPVASPVCDRCRGEAGMPPMGEYD
jgi:hypothetical protein